MWIQQKRLTSDWHRLVSHLSFAQSSATFLNFLRRALHFQFSRLLIDFRTDTETANQPSGHCYRWQQSQKWVIYWPGWCTGLSLPHIDSSKLSWCLTGFYTNIESIKATITSSEVRCHMTFAWATCIQIH